MNSDFLGRVVVTRDTVFENVNVNVTSKAVNMSAELEEGELSDYDLFEEVSSRIVTRPAVLSYMKGLEGMKKRNPWGGVAESWTAEVGRREPYALDTEYLAGEVMTKRKRVSVKERLGWKRRDEQEPGKEERREETMKWKEKMKRPRMEMVADMEERKIASKSRFYIANFAKKELFGGGVKLLNTSGSEKNKDVYENGIARTRELELDEKAIVRSVANDVEKSENSDDQVRRELTLSERFLCIDERRPKYRGKLERTVDFGKSGGKGAGGIQIIEGRMKDNRGVSALRKESVDSLENDNGSDLDDDAGMLIQVIQSDALSSDEESKRIRDAVAKIEEAKKREEIRRFNMKLMAKGELSKNLERVPKCKTVKIRKELYEKDFEVEDNDRKMKQRVMERRVKEKIEALKAANRKLLMEKTRQKKIREKVGAKKLPKSRLPNGSSRKRRKDETESSDTGSDTNSSSSSDASDNDSSSDSTEYEDKKREVKRPIQNSRTLKPKLMKQKDARGNEIKHDRVTSTPKKEGSAVQRDKVSSDEYKGKVFDLKSKLKDYLKKAKGKKNT